MTDIWKMQSRDDEIEYCKQHGIDASVRPQPAATAVTATCGTSATRDWSLRIRQTSRITQHMLVLGVTPEEAPDEGEYVTMTFEAGAPTDLKWQKR